MKFIIFFIFLISANSIYASEYKYLGEYDGADAYLFNIYEDHKYFGKKSKIYKLLFDNKTKVDGYYSQTLHLQVFCEDQSFVMLQQIQQCSDRLGTNCPVKDVYNFPDRIDVVKDSIIGKASSLICKTP